MEDGPPAALRSPPLGDPGSIGAGRPDRRPSSGRRAGSGVSGAVGPPNSASRRSTKACSARLAVRPPGLGVGGRRLVDPAGPPQQVGPGQVEEV